MQRLRRCKSKFFSNVREGYPANLIFALDHSQISVEFAKFSHKITCIDIFFLLDFVTIYVVFDFPNTNNTNWPASGSYHCSISVATHHHHKQPDQQSAPTIFKLNDIDASQCVCLRLFIRCCTKSKCLVIFAFLAIIIYLIFDFANQISRKLMGSMEHCTGWVWSSVHVPGSDQFYV